MARLSTTRIMHLPLQVWDWPTRVFHLAVILLLVVSYVSMKLATNPDTASRYVNIHLVSGSCLLGLLVFRLIWGVIGSETARFAHFVGSPIAGLRHLSRFAVREPDTYVGHNEAGGWMVLVMLFLLVVQVSSGLFVDGDGAPDGPLRKYAGKSFSDLMFTVHSLNINILLAAIGLHVIAVIAYRVVKRQDLIRPMITGKKRLPAATRAPRMAGPLKIGVVGLIAAAVAWVVATQV